MKRKLSSTSGEASDIDGNYGRSSLDEEAQPSSALELEQSIRTAEAGGFLLAPHLARSLEMRPGEMLFRSMFYGTPQAPHASDLAAQLLKEQERLFCLQSGEGTSSSAQLSYGHILDLMESNAAAIQALLDSVEAPPPIAVASAMAVGGVGTACGKEESSAQMAVIVGDIGTLHGQVSGIAEQSARDSDGGVVLAPDLAQLLGMQPGQVLLRGMFWGTPQSDIVLGIVGQLSEMREDLLRNQGLERSGVAPEGTGIDYEDTASLIATNRELVQALMASIEAPSFIAVPAVVMEDVGTHGQVTSSPEVVVVEDVGTVVDQVPGVLEQSASGSDGGFMLAPDLASRLGMYPGQVLLRGMFCGTPQSIVVLEMVSQLSEMRKDLLRNQGLERAGLIPEGTVIGCEDIASLIATNEELILALMSSIEEPAVAPEVTVIEDEDLVEELLEETVRQGTRMAKRGEGVLVSGLPAERMEEVAIRSAEILRGIREEKVARRITADQEIRAAKAAVRLIRKEDKEREGRERKEERVREREARALEKLKEREANRKKKEAEERERLERKEAEEREILERKKTEEREKLEKKAAIEKEKLEKKAAKKEEKLEKKKAKERERLEKVEKFVGEGELRLQKKEAKERVRDLELKLDLERARCQQPAAAIERTGLTAKEVELELRSEIERGRLLELDLEQAVVLVKEIKEKLRVAMDKWMDKEVLELDRDVAVARAREIEIRIEVLRLGARKRQLFMELKRLGAL
ncbi:hypothetical protein [Candidatus Ichthyocystis hellenicum]|uniref:hypothetical protein n=1 Tax=Candidatus Ichthyocystis hellenicum TaxID=1561003 RepID=UPI000B82A187|nr:hypothetical protein [Candidatus Ichthyocystis hellenicum]